MAGLALERELEDIRYFHCGLPKKKEDYRIRAVRWQMLPPAGEGVPGQQAPGHPGPGRGGRITSSGPGADP